MIFSNWRKIHFILAVTGSLFITIAALSGAILGIASIWDSTTPQAINLSDLTLDTVKNDIVEQFDEVYEIEQNKKGFIIVQGAKKNSYGSYYFNARDGKILGKVAPPSPFFHFIRSLHRSLFLKETGRIVMSLISFLMTLLVLSGLFLLRKRMGGFLNIYGAIDRIERFYINLCHRHMILGIHQVPYLSCVVASNSITN